MPHLILEYTANLEAEIQLEPLLECIHRRLIDLQLFPTGGIRSRARRVDTFRFADGAEDDAGIHIDLLLSGARSYAQRQEVGAAVFSIVCDYLKPLQARRYLALSLAVGTLEPSLFFNQNNLHERFGPCGPLNGDIS